MQTVQHTLSLLLYRCTVFLHSLGGRQAATLPPTFCCPAAWASRTNAGRAEPQSEPSAVPLHGLLALAGRHAGSHTPTYLRCPAAWPPALAGWNADRAESHSEPSAVPQPDLHALAGRRAGRHTPTNLLLPRCMASCTRWVECRPCRVTL